VLDFTSIATLFAFVLVCGGVLLIPKKEKQEGKFHIPYINGQFIFPLIIVGALVIICVFNRQYLQQLFNLSLTTEEAQSAVAGIDIHKTDFINNAIENASLAKKTLNVSTIIFWITCIVIGIFTFIKKYSLIPLLGLVTCLYLLTGMTAKNWAWFSSWLLIGLIVYFMYGYKKSKLAAGYVAG